MPTRFGCSYVLVCVNDSASGGKRIVMSSMLSLFEPGMCLENFAEVSRLADECILFSFSMLTGLSCAGGHDR